MRAAFILAGLTTLGIWRNLLLVLIFALCAWRIRRNVVFVWFSLAWILVCSGVLFMDSWVRANLPLAILGAVIFIVGLVVLGMTIRELLKGMGVKPVRRPRRNG